MNIQYYIENMIKIQENFLIYLEKEDNIEENFQKLINLLESQNIRSNEHFLKAFLYLLVKISHNHHRHINFFAKIEKIIQVFKDAITNFFTNYHHFCKIYTFKKYI